MGRFLAELKRRNVIRVGIFYAVAGWLVLQVADVLFGLLALPDWSLRLVFAILLLGLPLVLVLSWAFELTPEGLKRDRGAESIGQSTSESARRLDIATIVVLVLTVAVVAWDRLTPGANQIATDRGATPALPSAAPQPAELSIAVLPFENMSGNAENEYFSDGLSEELLNLLAKIPDFKVAGRTSSFAYKGRNENLRSIGDALDVANVLEGSVRRQADRVRITAQLVDTTSGYHRWSETYDRTIDDIFVVQEEIATEVVRALRTTLLNEDQRVIGSMPRTEMAAYDCYLQGQERARDRTRQGLERAVDAFQDAVVLDPQYAPAWSGLAMAYALQHNYGYVDTATIAPRIEPALERALALDPDNSEALAVRGVYLMNLAGGEASPESLESLKRAIEANPNNALAHLWYAQALLPDRRAATGLLERALALDPGSPIILRNYAVFLSGGGDSEGAARALDKLESIAPDWFSGWLARGEIAMLHGRVADAAIAMERARELNPDYVDVLGMLGRVYWLLGRQDDALAAVQEYARADPGAKAQETRAYIVALEQLSQGQFGNAFESYRRVVGARPTKPDVVANLAAFALMDGHAEEGIAIVRDGLGIEDLDRMPTVSLENGYAIVMLGIALRESGNRQAAARIGRHLVDTVTRIRETGFQNPGLDVGTGLGLDLQAQEGALEQGVRASIRAGWRNSIEELELLDPGDRHGADYDAVVDEMAAVLEAERRKYVVAKQQAATGA